MPASKTVAFIFARGGSKGVPRKNLREVGGRSLLARSIDVARQVPRISRVILSTDDPEIAEAGRRFGAEVPFLRPPELATDAAPERLSWRHAVQWVRDHDGPEALDTFISLPVTAPLRKVEDVKRCLDVFGAPPACDIVITMTRARSNPYFNMVRMTAEGLVTLAIADGAKPVRRQDAPKVFDMTCVAYVTTPDHIMTSDGVFDGRVKGVEVDEISAIDIDTEFDLKLAEMFAREYGL
jgi:CMP-N-acetylneuraminic acid synthetase